VRPGKREEHSQQASARVGRSEVATHEEATVGNGIVRLEEATIARGNPSGCSEYQGLWAGRRKLELEHGRTRADADPS
jgi:hypothetical protein